MCGFTLTDVGFTVHNNEWCTCTTCEVVFVHAIEQQQDDEEDETPAADDHPTQQEAVAAFSLNDLRIKLKWNMN